MCMKCPLRLSVFLIVEKLRGQRSCTGHGSGPTLQYIDRMRMELCFRFAAKPLQFNSEILLILIPPPFYIHYHYFFPMVHPQPIQLDTCESVMLITG